MSKELDMTEGNLFKKIFLFCLPLVLSGVLQLLYNACDLIVCGSFGSEHSVGAISSTGALIQLIINLFLGLSVGANVLMARQYGAKNQNRADKVVHTSMLLSVIVGIVIGGFGAIFSKYFLVWMGTTSDIIDLANDYLFIYFLGLPFMMIYNFGAAILRATGESKKPFIYLTVSGFINVCLNLLFVIVFNMDVSGVALATIISQAVASIMVVISMMKGTSFYKLELKKLKLHKRETIEIAKIGLPAGLQGVIFSLSNVLIQSSINSLGTAAVDGNGAAQSLEGFVYTVMNQTAQGGIAFVSANFGAGKHKNIKKSVIYTCIICAFFFLLSIAIILPLNTQLLNLYLKKNQSAMPYAKERLFIICCPYLLCGLMDIFAYSLRGIGYSILPMLITLVGACGTRILWIYAFFPLERLHSLQGLAISYPISWFLTAAVEMVLFIILFNKQNKKYKFIEGIE